MTMYHAPERPYGITQADRELFLAGHRTGWDDAEREKLFFRDLASSTAPMPSGSDYRTHPQPVIAPVDVPDDLAHWWLDGYAAGDSDYDTTAQQ